MADSWMVDERKNPVQNVHLDGKMALADTRIILKVEGLSDPRHDAFLRESAAAILSLLDRILVAVQALKPQPGPRPTMRGGGFMFRVPDDQADVDFEVIPPTILDAEGNTVPVDQVTLGPVASDNDSAVSVIPDTGGNPLKNTAHFGGPKPDGTPNTATLSCPVKRLDGTLVGTLVSDQFVITSGAPQTLTGGGFSFPGLTPVP